MITAAMITTQVPGDEGIARTVRHVMSAVAAFDILDVIANAAHEPAEETGAEFVTKLLQYCLDDLQGDLSYVVADKQTIGSGDLYTQYTFDVAQQGRGRFCKGGILV